MYRILIVEDDEALAAALSEQIEAWGMEAVCIRDFRKITEEFSEYEPQLVLLDISLPFFSGYYWCAELRRVTTVPIIFMSSAADNLNIVMAMNMGADDFIAKPFDPAVLIAKLRAVLRRAYDFAASSPILAHRGALFCVGDGTLSFGGAKIELTRNESRILSELLENKGKTVSRERLMERLWESDSFVDENTLTVNVARLRKKLDLAGLPDFIATKVGEGYIIPNEE